MSDNYNRNRKSHQRTEDWDARDEKSIVDIDEETDDPNNSIEEKEGIKNEKAWRKSRRIEKNNKENKFS